MQHCHSPWQGLWISPLKITVSYTLDFATQPINQRQYWQLQQLPVWCSNKRISFLFLRHILSRNSKISYKQHNSGTEYELGLVNLSIMKLCISTCSEWELGHLCLLTSHERNARNTIYMNTDRETTTCQQPILVIGSSSSASRDHMPVEVCHWRTKRRI